MNHILYVVLEPDPRWYRGQKIVVVRKRKPALAAGQVMVKLELNTPNNLFDPPLVPVVVTEQNITRPQITAKPV